MKKANLPARAEQWENEREGKCGTEGKMERGRLRLHERGKLREPSKSSV